MTLERRACLGDEHLRQITHGNRGTIDDRRGGVGSRGLLPPNGAGLTSSRPTPLVEKEETKIVPTLTVKLAPGCTRKVWLVYFAPNRVDLHAREETQIPLATTEPEVVCF